MPKKLLVLCIVHATSTEVHDASLFTPGATSTAPSCLSGLSDALAHPNYVIRIQTLIELVAISAPQKTNTCPQQQRHVKFASLNTQSLTNKTLLLNDFILDQGIDFLCLSETWHRSGDYLTLNEATPAGYKYIEKARSSGRGGGLAMFYRDTFCLAELQVPDSSSFECIAAKCLIPEPVLIVSIYRPPRANSALYQIFQISSQPCAQFFQAGSTWWFQYPRGCPQMLTGRWFPQPSGLPPTYPACTSPTHNHGHTLDLAITGDVTVTSTHVHELGISDHRVVLLDIMTTPPALAANVLSLSVKPRILTMPSFHLLSPLPCLSPVLHSHLKSMLTTTTALCVMA